MHYLNVLLKIKTNARRENPNTLRASRDAVRHFEWSGRAFFFGPFSRAARPSREESLFPTTLLRSWAQSPKSCHPEESAFTTTRDLQFVPVGNA